MLRLPTATWLASKHAARAAGEPQQHMRVVVEPATGNEGREIGGDGVKFEPGDEQREIMRVHADVGETGGSAGAGGIGAPFRLLLAVRVDRLGQPILDIGRVDDAQLPEFAGRDHFARLPHHGIAGVVERDREYEVASASASATSSRASGSVVDNGLSQMTSMPASRNALATG